VISFCADKRFSVDSKLTLIHDPHTYTVTDKDGASATKTRKGREPLIWDFLQRYDESWIWRCADRHRVTESTRNFAALEECIEDAARHGYVRTPAARKRAATGEARPSNRRDR
jgi:hypothetical protein